MVYRGIHLDIFIRTWNGRPDLGDYLPNDFEIFANMPVSPHMSASSRGIYLMRTISDAAKSLRPPHRWSCRCYAVSSNNELQPRLAPLQ